MQPTLRAPPALPPRVPSRPGDPPWEVALLFPTQGNWSEQEYLALDSKRMVELMNGGVEVLPTPTLAHQFIVRFLFKALDQFVAGQALGEVLFAPLPVRLCPGTYREPDIVYLRPERARGSHGQPEGADLVMEVLREGAENRERDLVAKRQDYAAAGIPEYWIVDPQEGRMAVLTLEGASYREHGNFGPGERATSVLLPGFAVDVDAVLAAGSSGA